MYRFKGTFEIWIMCYKPVKKQWLTLRNTICWTPALWLFALIIFAKNWLFMIDIWSVRMFLRSADTNNGVAMTLQIANWYCCWLKLRPWFPTKVLKKKQRNYILSKSTVYQWLKSFYQYQLFRPTNDLGLSSNKSGWGFL